MTTAVVPFNSELKRKGWLMEGLVQAKSLSFWSRFTGRTFDSVVYQETNVSASDGHTVVFDFDGNLAGAAVKGKETAYGKGEQLRKFSDKITVDRYRLVVDNGDKFDGVDIGDLTINAHTNARSKLADLFIRFKDQTIFDTVQGRTVAPTHSIQKDIVSSGFTFALFAEIENTLKTGVGYMTGVFGSSTAAEQRAPLKSYRDEDGRPTWLMLVDSYTVYAMRRSTTMQTLLSNADNRGSGNAVISGQIARVGNLLIVEADTFFGSSTSTGFNKTKTEIAGMRQWDDTNSAWSGESGYVATVSNLFSRCVILGAGAVQLALGKMPEYHHQFSEDFKIKSESAVEFWMNTRKTNLVAENEDYEAAKIAGLDHSVIALDLKIQ